MTRHRRLTRAVLAAGACLTALAAPTVASAQEPYIGQIEVFGFDFCPRGWAPADGQLLPISQYTALFSLYRTTYGGDGLTTFALPDMRQEGALGSVCIALVGIFPSRN